MARTKQTARKSTAKSAPQQDDPHDSDDDDLPSQPPKAPPPPPMKKMAAKGKGGKSSMKTAAANFDAYESNSVNFDDYTESVNIFKGKNDPYDSEASFISDDDPPSQPSNALPPPSMKKKTAKGKGSKSSMKKAAANFDPYDSESEGFDDYTESVNLFKGKKMKKQKLLPNHDLYEADHPRKEANLKDILSSNVLHEGKKNLKKSGTYMEPYTIDRTDLISPYSPDFKSTYGSLTEKEWPSPTEVKFRSGHNVVALDFSGMEQISDMFMYSQMNQKIHIPLLERISLTGCTNLTDTGVIWMTSAFHGIKYVDLNGCKNLTEMSLYAIIKAWESTLYEIGMIGTNVGLIPLKYEGSIRVEGCPVISPAHKLYTQTSVKMADKMNRPTTAHSCFKMVIFTEDMVPWSPLALMCQESDLTNKKALRVKKNLTIDKEHTLNIFELPMNSGFSEIVMSEGSIVVMPYLLADDGPDLEYADNIVRNMAKIYSKYQECVFVLMPLTEKPGLESVASRYHNLINQQFKTRIMTTFGEALGQDAKDRFKFHALQKISASGSRMNDRYDKVLTKMSGNCFVQSGVMVINSDLKLKISDLVLDVTTQLQSQFPARFISYQAELKNAVADIDKLQFPLTDLQKLCNQVISKTHVQEAFTTLPDASPYVGKILEFMAAMGKVLYYPGLKGSPALSDFALLETVYQKLMTQDAPTRASWRFLGSNVPCWTVEDLTGLCPDKATFSHLIDLLEGQGVLIKLYRDVWTTELKNTYAYVLYTKLPFYPKIDVEDYWPEYQDENELQLERYFTFLPGMPDSFFPSVIRQSLSLGGVRLLWDKGIIIQKGPISILLEHLTDQYGTSVLFLGARLMKSGEASKKEEIVFNTLSCTMTIYENIVTDLLMKLDTFAKAYIPCPTCLPSKNRYKTVNSGESAVSRISALGLWGKLVKKTDSICKNDGSQHIPVNLLGQDVDIRSVVPCHYYLGCLPSFSAYNRCMFCHNCALAGAECEGNLANGATAWNCSCNQEGQMCSKCGLCQRCVSFLCGLSSSLHPPFQETGSVFSLDQGGVNKLPQDLSPNYCPVVELCFIRGANINLTLKMGSMKIEYDTGSGSIGRFMNNQEKAKEKEESWRCKQGFRVAVELRFSQADADDMDIIIRVRGTEIYRYTYSSQSCAVEITAEVPMSLVITTPAAVSVAPQELDSFNEKVSCNYTNFVPVVKSLPSSIEALLIQGKQFIENALFQAGGVNYSGSSYIMLPENLTMEMLQFPSYLHVKEQISYHLLCYTRSKISDALTFGGSQAVPESWAVYRMLHLVDNKGMPLLQSKQTAIETNAGTLLLAWHFLFKMLPKISLPKVYSQFLPVQDLQEADMIKVEAGLRDLLDLSYWRLLCKLDIIEILPTFEDLATLLAQAQTLQRLADSKKFSMEKVTSKYNESNTLYLCPGHHASMKVEEGITEVLPDIYGSYSTFLLSVDLPANMLTAIPEEMFSALPNLAEFDCSNNFIEVLPASIGNCRKLYNLSIAENNITDLPDTLSNCTEIYRIDISSNTMVQIPAVVMKMKSLKRLYASNLFLTSLPENIGELESLDKLYLNGNCLTSLPKSFANLKELTDLAISGIPWFNIPKSGKVMSFENFMKYLKQWRTERWLEAHKENREELFKFFDEDGNGVLDVVELGRLNAALFNMFPRFGYKGREPPEDDTASGFPMEIMGCSSLEYLSICYHGFVHVPAEIGQLQELKMLSVGHNPNLLTIPGEVGTISCLTRIEMDDCPLLKTPPKEIRAKGFATTFAYLKRLTSGSMPCKRTKLMLVGLGGAGKTSLVKSLFSKDGKADLTHGENITDGIDISSWTVKTGDESVTYSVWDFAGQTVYYNTHQFFLSNRAVYLLLWNVRLGYEHAGLDFWLSSISVQAPKAPIFVVGSHVDQVSKFEVPINEMRARYKQVAGFHFISSYTGKGISELKEKLFDVTLQQQYMGEQIPEVWLTFENNVVSERAKSNVIEYKALENMASVSGIFEKTEVSQAVQFLHELGSLQHFTTQTLKSRVVINPQWIVDVMACVVSVKNSPIQEGRLNHKDIATVWKDYPADLHDWLLKLTEEYDLTFSLQNEPINLVPCLLPETQPQFTLPELNKDGDIKENKMIYKFDYLPAGLFNRGQVRLHQISDSALIWKKGSYLKKNGHMALLQQIRDSEMVVTVQGPRPDNVLFLVHEVFEGLIAESFRGVHYDYLIPCPDCLRMMLKDPHMFCSSTIRRALELKAPFLQCVKYFHTISCVDLLACMPPDNHSDFDLHLMQSVRSLRDLRKDLSADIFMSYCPKDAPSDRSKVIHPATVCDDLSNLGYKCWFPQTGKSYSIEEMARALTDASVFVVFISSDYVEDEECVNIFKYARLTLRKPMVVVAVGNGFEWKQSKLGILLSDEVFVNMIKSKKGVYSAKFDELVSAINSRTNKQLGGEPVPSCFFSYTWVNSAKAVALGTRSVPGALGYGDPREIKQYLEDQDVKCWIDVERVGQNGLFDDIAEGLLSAKVVVVCVSDEYADSPTCRMEFRYAANTLNLPIILAIVGKGHKWRQSEVGVLSLQYPVVSFQEKSDTCFSSLLALVQERMAKTEKDTTKESKNKANQDQKNLSFQELFELAQRKLLRQLSFYAEHQDVDVYPRLFIVDFAKTKADTPAEEKGQVQEGEGSAPEKPKLLKRMASVDERTFSKKISELDSAFRIQRYCVHILCEHDEGWHSVTDPLPLPHEFAESMLDKFSPFIARVTAVMKHNKHFSFHCLESEVGEDYLKWLEENPQATMSDYQQVYHDFRQMVIEADSHQAMGQMARCRLPNGKIIWLCEKHRENMKVTVLSSEDASINRETVQTGGNEMHMIAGLRTIEPQEFSDKFTSAVTAKRVKDAADMKPVKLAGHVDLLPDTKMPTPSVVSEMKASLKSKEEQNPSEKKPEVKAKINKKMPSKKFMAKGKVSIDASIDEDEDMAQDLLDISGNANVDLETEEEEANMLSSNLEMATEQKTPQKQQQQQQIPPPPPPVQQQQQQQQQKQQQQKQQQQQQQKQQQGLPPPPPPQQQQQQRELESNQRGAMPEPVAKAKTFYGQDRRQQSQQQKLNRPQSSRGSKPEKGSRTCHIM